MSGPGTHQSALDPGEEDPRGDDRDAAGKLRPTGEGTGEGNGTTVPDDPVPEGTQRKDKRPTSPGFGVGKQEAERNRQGVHDAGCSAGAGTARVEPQVQTARGRGRSV